MTWAPVIFFAGSMLGPLAWAFTGLGSNHLRQSAHSSQRNRGEVGGVIKISHLDRSI